MIRVVCTKWIPDELAEAYQAQFCFVRPEQGHVFSKEELTERMPGADVLFSVAGTPVTADLIDAGGKLRVIASLGVGYDHVDVEYASGRRIPVVNSPTEVSDPTAEHTIALMMGIFHNLYRYTAQVKQGVWRTEAFGSAQTSVAGHTLGIVGMGRIGRCVAKKAAALGMQVSYFDPRRLEPAKERELGVKYVDFDTLLSESDCVTLHVPYTGKNRHMFDAGCFAHMKTGAYFVNASRGALVDTAALAEALRSGSLKGAALDVFETEPYTGDELDGLEQVVLTPHVASETRQARIRMARECLNGVKSLLAGQMPENIVNPQVLGEAERR